MDSRNVDNFLTPSKPKLLPLIHHHPKTANSPMLSTPLYQNQDLQIQSRKQQQQQLSTNNFLCNIKTNDTLNSSNIRSINNNPNIHNNVSTNNSTVTNSDNCSDDISGNCTYTSRVNVIAQSSLTTSSATSLQNSTTISPTNSFTRRKIPLPTTNIPLISSISSSPNINRNVESLVSLVTLATPRPENERLTNEYVDTPFQRTHQLQHSSRCQHPAGQTSCGQTTTQHNLILLRNQRQHHQHIHFSHYNRSNNAVINGATAFFVGAGVSSALLQSSVGHKRSTNNDKSSLDVKQTLPSATTFLLPGQKHITNNRPVLLNTKAITKQPMSFAKDTSCSVSHNDLEQQHIEAMGVTGSLFNSITCPHCKRCRCEQCQIPRQLPSRWLCNKTCLCSAETIIDYASCLCCVKALFYHCAKDHELECNNGDSISCVDDPCSCLPHKRVIRWSWLCALSFVLPCLWYYWPMRGCVAMCATCYARHSEHGCRCQPIISTIVSPESQTGIKICTKPSKTYYNTKKKENCDKSGDDHTAITQTSDFTSDKSLLDLDFKYQK